MRLSILCCFVVALATVLPAQVSAQERARSSAITVIQPKPVLRANRVELRPRIAATVGDPLMQQYALAGSFGFNISERVSIFATGEWYDFGDLGGETSRFSEVIGDTAAIPEVVRTRWYGGLETTWAPTYGKFAFFNQAIVFWDIYLLGGIGFMETTRSPNPTVALGAGANLYLNRWLSINLEFKDRISIEEYDAGNSLRHGMTVGGGLGIQLPFNFRYPDEREVGR